MICPDDLVQGLERVFNCIQEERMQGVPVLNSALRVAAVGFTPWQGNCLGVLITPWFMNLMPLPDQGGEWEELAVGAKVTNLFLSGAYESIVCSEEGIGRYLMCSLFSPVFEFADQQTAVATAEAVIAGLMAGGNRDETSMREHEVERIWQGKTVPEEPSDQKPTLGERLGQPTSRRDLLRGRFSTEPRPDNRNQRRRLGLAPALVHIGLRNEELGQAPAYIAVRRGWGSSGLYPVSSYKTYRLRHKWVSKAV